MHVHHGYTGVAPEYRGAMIAIGNFDGVHLGHQALLNRVLQHAAEHRAPAGALVFEPHPRIYFQPQRPHFTLTPLKLKLRLLALTGLDVTFVVPFDGSLAAMRPETFASEVLVAGLGVSHVVVGYDFFFGHRRSGDAALLKRLSAELGFGVTVVPPVGSGGEVYSSSAIRAELAQGDVKGAAEMMGRRWQVEGVVQAGAHRGTSLGFPTANIALGKGAALAHGIYAVYVDVEGVRRPGAAYLGTRPTFDDGSPVLEVFLFDFNGDLYGKTMTVEFVEYLRGDRKFSSAEQLKEQMARDCERARAVLAAHTN